MIHSRLEAAFERFKAIVYVLLFVALILGSCYCEKSIWDECRQQHSFLYCYRTLYRD